MGNIFVREELATANKNLCHDLARQRCRRKKNDLRTLGEKYFFINQRPQKYLFSQKFTIKQCH